MRKLVNTKRLTHEEWLEWRRLGIGGSDVAAICGYSPWKSPYAVYLEKTGIYLEEPKSSEAMRVGRDLEDYVARRFVEATGKKVRRNNFMLCHDDHDFIMANIDREVVGENAILECKTTNSFAAKDWENDVPLHYQFQCYHYMLVTGCERCYVAVLIGNQAFRYHVLERDDVVIQLLLEKELDFWHNHVMAKVEPPADGSKNYTDMLNERFKNSIEDEIILAENEYLETIERLDEVKKMEKEVKEERAQLEQVLKNAMAEHEIAFIGERKITWKLPKNGRLDTKLLKAEKPEIYQAFLKPPENRIFRA